MPFSIVHNGRRTSWTNRGTHRCVAAAAAVAITVGGPGCGSAAPHQYAAYADAIPAASDWVDCGSVLAAGGAGEWDLYLWGGFAASVLKRDGQYLLYYQGSDGYHEEEATVTNRAIGVATSADGIRFTKYPGNPILTFSHWNNHEEGAVSSAPFLDESNRVVMYYGANTWAGADQVNADARLAISDDGIHFTDHGVTLDHTDASVWGSGDELFPVIALRHGERLMLYYIPNGTLQQGRLGAAWSDGAGPLRTAAVKSGLLPVRVWGSGSAVRIAPDVYALFLAHRRGGAPPYMDVRIVSPARPDRLSAPVHRYVWDGISPRAVLLDEEERRWLLYYRDTAYNQYGVMVAATGPARAGYETHCAPAAGGRP